MRSCITLTQLFIESDIHRSSIYHDGSDSSYWSISLHLWSALLIQASAKMLDMRNFGMTKPY